MARNKLIKFLRNTHDKFMSFLIYWGWEYRIKKRKLKRKYYPLTREQKKEIRSYWKRFGKRVSPDWAGYFCSFLGEYSKLVIPESLYYTQIQPYLNVQDMNGLADKNLANRIFTTKMPGVLARKMNGEFFDGVYNKITINQAMKIIVDHGECFIKPSRNSSYGDGALVWKKEQKQEKLEKALSSDHKDLIIQEIVKQHNDLAKFHPNSLNTIRIVSLRINNKTVILNSILRMGKENSIVDNYSKGGYICNLYSNGYLFEKSTQITGVVLDRHPDTNEIFSGNQIPSFENVISEVVKQHDIVPFFRLIAWDFAINREGDPVLIEANFPSGQIDLHQLNNPGLFGEYTDQVLTEVYGKK